MRLKTENVKEIRCPVKRIHFQTNELGQSKSSDARTSQSKESRNQLGDSLLNHDYCGSVIENSIEVVNLKSGAELMEMFWSHSKLNKPIDSSVHPEFKKRVHLFNGALFSAFTGAETKEKNGENSQEREREREKTTKVNEWLMNDPTCMAFTTTKTPGKRIERVPRAPPEITLNRCSIETKQLKTMNPIGQVRKRTLHSRKSEKKEKPQSAMESLQFIRRRTRWPNEEPVKSTNG